MDARDLSATVREALSRVPALKVYYESLPEGVSSEANAEAEVLLLAGHEALAALVKQAEDAQEWERRAIERRQAHARVVDKLVRAEEALRQIHDEQYDHLSLVGYVECVRKIAREALLADAGETRVSQSFARWQAFVRGAAAGADTEPET